MLMLGISRFFRRADYRATLHKHYLDRDWQAFARIFLSKYETGTNSEQLELLRLLLSTYRRQELLELITPALA